MATKDYNFQYVPLTGRLPGNSFVKQTEQAINELAGIVNEGSAQVEVITNLANTANANSEEALEKANEALETSGRVYITLPNLSDADDYYDSQLYYFANSYSHNLPVQGTGFLEVKTNDTKTACEQVFIADLTGSCYFRHGIITATEVGSETVYSVTWDIWSSSLASENYVQRELTNYLPLSGGTLTGDVNGVTPPAGDNSKKIANTEFIQALASILVPTGCVQAFAGNTVPDGWLLCDGSAISRTDYADLYAVIGDTYGAGDGTSTFNLPDLIDKFVQGNAVAGTEHSAGLPNITGQIQVVIPMNANPDYSSALLQIEGSGCAVGTNSVNANYFNGVGITTTPKNRTLDINASRSSSVYGNSTTVQPPSVTMRYIIKY